MEEQKNNCYECPYRKKVSGSTHSECVHPVIRNSALAALLSIDDDNVLATNILTYRITAAIALQKKPSLLEPHITLDEDGLRGGWATWPIDFDPIWITCKLKIAQ